MNNLGWIPVAAVLILSAGLLHADDASGVPDMILRANGDVMWVSVDRALNPDGILDERALRQPTETLRREARQQSREARQRTAESTAADGRPQEHDKTAPASAEVCSGFLSLPWFTPSNPNTLFEESKVIVAGRVIGIKEGFFFNSPGSLLAITGKTIKGDLSGPAYLLFYPYARIKTAEGMICAGSALEPPRSNDRVLLFSPMEAVLAHDSIPILYVDVEHNVVYQGQSRLHLPPGLPVPESATFDLILKETQQTLSHTRRIQ